MFNLSDKDLDRLSQEAAQQHEPGDIVGPRFWEKLETRLDRDLGKVTPNPARGIRRLPYYYAPALLVILGVTYYFVRPNNKSYKGMSSGSPPLTAIRPAPADPLKPTDLSPNPVPSDNSNSTPTAPSNTVRYPGTAGASSIAPAASARPGAALAHATPSTNLNDNSSLTSTNSPLSSRQRHRHNHVAAGETANPGTAITSGQTQANTPATTRTSRDLTFSAVRGLVRIARRGSIDDSALRAFTLSSIRQPIRKGSLRINRSLTIGIMGGPDYASVNSIAGDRPGSTIGFTVDYQFANHFYIGSGLLFARKIFAAAPEDYHVSPKYYFDNNMPAGGIDYIKGTFNMLEIPLDLRYDFSSSNNALFFLSAGTSSYLFTKQNCGYYFNYNPRNIVCKNISYAGYPNDLFATLNLSMGAEFGISNSLSAMVAPYVKIPTRGIGFGQVQLNSFGIDFALRFTPVLSRKR
jgi:hypothetical protein